MPKKVQSLSDLLEKASQNRSVKVRGIELTLTPPPAKAHFEMVAATQGIEDEIEREYVGLAVILTHCLPDEELSVEDAQRLLLISAKEGGGLIKAIGSYVEFGNTKDEALAFTSAEKPEGGSKK